MTRPASKAALFDAERAWVLLRELARRAKLGVYLERAASFWVDDEGHVDDHPEAPGVVRIDPDRPEHAEYLVGATAEARRLMDLYLPLCVGQSAEHYVVAHLGQSLDGQIALQDGASRGLTGTDNHRHLHRLRALSDAVVVGASTVEKDDPELTTRLVPGEHCARVVIDPKRRTPPESRIYRDGKAPTWVICEKGRGSGPTYLELSSVAELFSPEDIVSSLRRVGLKRLLIEGGGVTVSRFVEARALDWLHVAVSPAILGAGTPGLALPPIAALKQAIRPRVRHFQMDDDVLFECRFATG